MIADVRRGAVGERREKNATAACGGYADAVAPVMLPGSASTAGRGRFVHRRIRTELLLILGLFPSGIFAEESPLEEIVVTGSYIKSSPIDAPSPVDVTDRQEIDPRSLQRL